MNQRGGLPVFKGHSHSQFGRGLGNIIGGLFRSALPLLAPTAKSLGKGIVRMGATKLLRALDGGGSTAGRRTPRPPQQHKRRARAHSKPVAPRKRKRLKRDLLLSMASESIEKHGCLCTKSELDLFTNPPVNVSMQEGRYEIHHPIATLTPTSPIEFHCPASVDRYIDVGRTLLRVKLKVTKNDGSNLDEGAKVSTVNLLLHSLFSQVDVKLNGQLVSASVNTYPYTSYFQTLLSHGKESKSSWLQAEGFYPDDRPLDAHDPSLQTTNPGLAARRDKISGSKIVDLVGRPHVPILNQDRYIITGVNMDFKFTRSSKEFHLMSPTVEDFKTEILHASLLVRKVKLNPTISLQHASLLASGKNAQYPLKRTVTTCFTVPADSLSFNRENAVSGELPRRCIVAILSNKAFNGHGKANPYYFGNHHLNYLTITAGSQQFPATPLTPNFPSNEFTDAFVQLYQAVGLHNSDGGLDIGLDTFKQGHTLYAFDFTTDMCTADHIEPLRYGSLRIEASFAQPLPAPVNVLLWCE